MGGNMDAVATDNIETAKACMKILTEQKHPPMTFLPLSDI